MKSPVVAIRFNAKLRHARIFGRERQGLADRSRCRRKLAQLAAWTPEPAWPCLKSMALIPGTGGANPGASPILISIKAAFRRASGECRRTPTGAWP